MDDFEHELSDDEFGESGDETDKDRLHDKDRENESDLDEESLDSAADLEDEPLLEDSFDDQEPEELW